MKTEKTIGIIGAMEDEVAALKKAMADAETIHEAGMEFVCGTIGNVKAIAVQCGMGKVNAGVCAQLLISLFHADAVINTGVAGSLNNDLDIGDIVISKDAVQHDFDVSAIGFAKGEIPYTGLYAFEADSDLQALAKDAVTAVCSDIKAVSGRICSGDQFIASKIQKQKIIDEFHGDCAEMEGAAIAQVCYLNRIPFVIIRAISDKADDSEEVSFELFAKQAAANSSSAVLYMLANL